MKLLEINALIKLSKVGTSSVSKRPPSDQANPKAPTRQISNKYTNEARKVPHHLILKANNATMYNQQIGHLANIAQSHLANGKSRPIIVMQDPPIKRGGPK